MSDLMSDRGPEIVRLTLHPAGAKRKVTVWARVMKRSENLVIYRQVSADGDESFDGGTKDGKAIEEIRMIAARPSEVKERRAIMSWKYGEFVAEGSREWESEKIFRQERSQS